MSTSRSTSMRAVCGRESAHRQHQADARQFIIFCSIKDPIGSSPLTSSSSFPTNPEPCYSTILTSMLKCTHFVKLKLAKFNHIQTLLFITQILLPPSLPIYSDFLNYANKRWIFKFQTMHGLEILLSVTDFFFFSHSS